RNMNTRLVDLFLVLEAAILCRMDTVEDVMVRSPVAAAPWHRVGHARKVMLSHSFSALPICVAIGEKMQWKLLTDEAIVKITRGRRDVDRNARLSLSIEEAIAKADLQLEMCGCCKPADRIADLLSTDITWPLLVIET